MEKLNNLVKEYLKIIDCSSYFYLNKDRNLFFWDCCDSFYDFALGVDQYIISKEFGFIKRLIDNDKIDLNEFMHKSWDWDIFNEKLSANEDNYLSLLMLLSIQDNPIEWLCGILKD